MKDVVIIGGGFAGIKIAKESENFFNVTLIDSKDYFEFTPGILRTIVNPTHIEKLQVKYNSFLKKCKVIIGNVKTLNKDFVFINNKKIKFDYLAICSGSSYKNHFKDKRIILSDRTKEFFKINKDLIGSNSILIVGGGLVGVELAAELIRKYSHKQITIIHSKDRLIERNPKKASDYANHFLKNNNVKILYNSTKLLKSELTFLCTGINVNSQFLNKNFKESLDNKNKVIVNNYLQVRGYRNIFAAGDVNNLFVEKTAQNAEKQSKIVVKNINALENNKKLINYSHKKTPLVISLGKYNGILIWNNFVFTGIIPGLLKNLIEKYEIFKIKRL